MYRVFRRVPTTTPFRGWKAAADRPYTDVETAEEAKAVCRHYGEPSGQCEIRVVDGESVKPVCLANWSLRDGVRWSPRCKI